MMIKKIAITTLFFLTLAPITTTAEKKNKNVLDIKTSITDDAIVFPESFEQDTRKMLEGWYLKNYTASDDNYRKKGDVHVSDEELTRRLAELETVIDLPFNQVVRKYIERYTDRGRSQVASLLGLSLYYNPIFESALEQQGLPLELKYLPVIESGLNPNAVSHAGAAGLWQIMPVTARGLGLELTSLVDQRRDPYLSSQKAVKYLKDLYETYNDWSMAIAAYNCGPGTVNKAIRRAGGDPKSHNFWTIYNYLPAETRGYVPMFIAATYVMNYYPQHNISPVLPTKPLVTDTVHIDKRVHFNQIASVLDVPLEEIRILNPQYRNDIIPGSASKLYSLTLPAQQIQAYIVSEQDILAYQSEKYARVTVAEPGMVASDAALLENESERAEEAQNIDEQGNPTDFDELPAVGEDVVEPEQTRRESPSKPVTVKKLSPGQSVVHKVQEGESLASIAELYGVTAEQIKTSNNMRRNSVRIGQQLKVEAPGKQNVKQNVASEKKPSVQNPPVASQSAEEKQQQATPAKKQVVEAATPAKKQNKQQEQAPASSKKSKTQKAQTQASSSKSKKSKQQAAPAPAVKEHKIKEGESLSSIAKREGVTVDELRKANNIKGDHIRAGKTLNIPSKQKSNKKSSSASKKSSAKKKKR